MRKFILGYILATILIGTASFAQTKEDATDLENTIFDLLCAGQKNIDFKKSNTDLFQKVEDGDGKITYQLIVHTNTDLQPWQKRIVALEYSQQAALKYFNTEERYKKIKIKFARETEFTRYLYAPNKPPLIQSIMCSPLKVQYINEVHFNKLPSTGNFRPISTSLENRCEGAAEDRQGYEKKADGTCGKICDRENEHFVVGRLIGKNILPNNVSTTEITDLYSGCVPCSDKQFGSGPQYGYSEKNGNECFDIDGCKNGYSIQTVKLSTEFYHTQTEIFQENTVHIYNRILRDLLNDSSPKMIARVCVENCTSIEERNSDGVCAPSLEKACKTTKHYYSIVQRWDPLQTISSYQTFHNCFDDETRNYLKSVKSDLIRDLSKPLLKCQTGEMTISDIERISFDYFWRVETLNVSGIINVSDLPKCLKQEITDPEDNYNQFQPIFPAENNSTEN